MHSSTAPRFFGANLGDHTCGGLRLVRTRHPPHDELPWHRHGSAYLTLVVAGSYHEQLRGSSGLLGVGQAVVHPRGEQHRDLFAAAGAELLNLELTDEALDGLGAATAAFERRRELPAGAAGPLVARLLAELRAPDELTPLVLEGALLDLAARLLRQGPLAAARREPTWLRQLDRLLADRFSEPWTLAALAAHLAVHPHHLSRAVRRHRRTSVGAWLRRLRVEHAAQLLRTALPLAEVALRAGFCDQSHLSRCFSRLFGTTPGAWRRACRQPG